LQQQQQKYAAQQAGYDRLFQVGRDNMQNRFQADRDRRQNEFQLGRDKQQNDFILGRDKAQSQQQQQEQRAKDFADARSRMDAYAKDALSNPEIPHEVRQKIQNLLSAKMVALAPNQYTPEAQQEFLDQYNAQLAGILSEIPPPKPKAPAQPNFHTDQNGNQWVESGPGKWEQVPKQAQQPMTAQDYYNNPDNADKFQKDLDATMGAMQDAYDEDPSKPKPTPQLAWEQMQKDYQFRMQALGRNAQAGLPPAGQPFQLPSDRMAPAMGTVDPMTGQPVQSGTYGTIPQQGVPQSPGGIPIAAQPPAPQAQSAAMPLTANSSSQNAWSEVAAADVQQRQPMPLTANASSSNPAGEVPMPTSQVTAPATAGDPQREVTQAAEPNFKDLEANAQDDMDKSIIRKMRTVYGQNESPEVRGAISALLGDDPIQAAKAADYLQSVGIDLEKLTAEAQYSGTGRGQVRTSQRSNSSARYGSGRGGVRTK